MVRKKILLTGASGTVGKAVFKILLEKTNQYEISLFLRGSSKNRKLFKPYADRVNLFWGTLQNVIEVKEAVNAQDVVLHVAAALPDVGFKNPDLLISTNVNGTQNIINAMLSQLKKPKLIYTSSVAVYGDRRKNPKIKLSDPIDIDSKDLYTKSKINAEKLVKESNLEYVIFRVSYVTATDMIKFRQIMFYMGLDTSVETIHAKDTGLALVNAINSKEVWSKTFNLGGGKKCQISYRDNVNDMFEIMGFGRNFLPDEAFSRLHSHCGFFDAHETSYLQEILKYQTSTLEDFYDEVREWIGIKRYLVPLVKPILRWYILRKSEFYQKAKKSSHQHAF
ncbi:MAG: NAD(P)-dependent oxidoreductase [Candidatus Lokiarchaeota archaeon]|nr:NAD(P)-dependent oxidoreductase [Candidatus Lokiarchaeota archaeon]